MAQDYNTETTTHDGSRKPFAPDNQEIERIVDSTITPIINRYEQLQQRCSQEVERLQGVQSGMHETAQHTIEVVEKYIHLLYGMATNDTWTEQEIITALQSSQYCFGGVYDCIR